MFDNYHPLGGSYSFTKKIMRRSTKIKLNILLITSSILTVLGVITLLSIIMIHGELPSYGIYISIGTFVSVVTANITKKIITAYDN